MSSAKTRCGWVTDDPLYLRYHDEEWGVPVHDDRALFEMLTLEGAQAGLSWLTILRKRENYRAEFAGFDPQKVARFTARDVDRLLQNSGIVRNRSKIESTIDNARAFLDLQSETGSFANWLWAHVQNDPIRNHFATLGEVPAKTALSDHISKALKKRGFRFVGSTIVYAFLQAVGVVDDHLSDCFVRRRRR